MTRPPRPTIIGFGSRWRGDDAVGPRVVDGLRARGIDAIEMGGDGLALVERLRAGDDEAYEHLVREHTGRMLAVARRILGNDDDAGDAVQDAFLSAFKSLDRFEGGSKLSTWLHRITVNAALGRLRRRRKQAEAKKAGELGELDELLPRFKSDGHPERYAQPWA